jgi:hypothetical protein
MIQIHNNYIHSNIRHKRMESKLLKLLCSRNKLIKTTESCQLK